MRRVDGAITVGLNDPTAICPSAATPGVPIARRAGLTAPPIVSLPEVLDEFALCLSPGRLPRRRPLQKRPNSTSTASMSAGILPVRRIPGCWSA